MTADASSKTAGATKTLKIDVKTPAATTDGSVELPAELFDVEANIALMHQVVTAQLAAARQGTHLDQDARRGARWRPEAVPAEGHRPRPSGFDARAAVHRRRHRARPEAARLQPAHSEEDDPGRAARRASDRARNGRIHAVTELVEGQTPSTKNAKAFLTKLVEGKQVLIVIGRSDETGAKSVRNLPGVHALSPDQLNTYDVLHADDVVFSVEALDSYISANTDQEVSA